VCHSIAEFDGLAWTACAANKLASFSVLQVEGDAQLPSYGAEEDLGKSGEEEEHVSLEGAYRSILTGAGLSAEALESWLDSWMKFVSAEVVDLAKGGIASLIPGSKAAELIVQHRLGRAVAVIAGRAGQLPLLQIALLHLMLAPDYVS